MYVIDGRTIVTEDVASQYARMRRTSHTILLRECSQNGLASDVYSVRK